MRRANEAKRGPSIVVGMGTGQSGLHALAELLRGQPDSFVTFEMPPLLPWKGHRESGRIAERVGRIFRTRDASLVGDVASFYLPHVDELVSVAPAVRIICLEVGCEEMTALYAEWADHASALPMDHWSAVPEAGCFHDPLRTHTYPHYSAVDRVAALHNYWHDYRDAARALADRYPSNVRLFDAHRALETRDGQIELLTFAGIPTEKQIVSPVPIHAGEARPIHHRRRRTALAAATDADPQRCVVLVPFSGSITPGCEASLRELERRGYTVWRVSGFSAIDEGRSHLATEALVQGFTETMWIDADVEFEPQSVDRLRSHGEPIVCGIYAQKGRRGLACYEMPGTEELVFGHQGGLAEVLYAGGGFLLVRRQVYAAIQRELDLPVCNELFGRPMIPFFQPLIREHADASWYLAEDYAFGERARRCGFRILADTSVRLWHIGGYSYSWEDAVVDRDRYGTVVVKFGHKPD